MKYFSVYLVFYFFLLATVCRAYDRPCKEKSVGVPCYLDEECYGPNTICFHGKCACQLGFEPYLVSSQIRICRPAPGNIGDECQRDCKPPLLCRKGKCECWQGKYFNDTCVVECPEGQEIIGNGCQRVAHLNDSCKSDKHCIDPFTGCVDGVCQCRSGTLEVNGNCLAFCPDGQPLLRSCRRLHSTDDEVLSQLPQTDSCPSGYTCMTYGNPLTGHCCKLYCPFGNAAANRSCHRGAPEHQKCRQLTHYCHSVRSPGWSGSMCCPRPCREPTPYFINGKCWSNARLGDPCHFTEQCEGGRTMVCKGRRCLCKTGFVLALHAPFPTCVKPCPIRPMAPNKECLTKVKLRQSCVVDSQCPQFSRCYYGKCRCDCGYVVGGVLGDVCQNPDDPFNLHPLINRFEHFFGG